MEVIGAGFGRTGTLSLKAALERLGFSPCYHMVEVPRRGHGPFWREAMRRKARGEPLDIPFIGESSGIRLSLAQKTILVTFVVTVGRR